MRQLLCSLRAHSLTLIAIFAIVPQLHLRAQGASAYCSSLIKEFNGYNNQYASAFNKMNNEKPCSDAFFVRVEEIRNWTTKKIAAAEKLESSCRGQYTDGNSAASMRKVMMSASETLANIKEACAKVSAIVIQNPQTQRSVSCSTITDKDHPSSGHCANGNKSLQAARATQKTNPRAAADEFKKAAEAFRLAGDAIQQAAALKEAAASEAQPNPRPQITPPTPQPVPASPQVCSGARYTETTWCMSDKPPQKLQNHCVDDVGHEGSGSFRFKLNLACSAPTYMAVIETFDDNGTCTRDVITLKPDGPTTTYVTSNPRSRVPRVLDEIVASSAEVQACYTRRHRGAPCTCENSPTTPGPAQEEVDSNEHRRLAKIHLDAAEAAIIPARTEKNKSTLLQLLDTARARFLDAAVEFAKANDADAQQAALGRAQKVKEVRDIEAQGKQPEPTKKLTPDQCKTLKNALAIIKQNDPQKAALIQKQMGVGMCP